MSSLCWADTLPAAVLHCPRQQGELLHGQWSSPHSSRLSYSRICHISKPQLLCYSGVLLLLEMSVPILKFGELDQTSGWPCQSIEAQALLCVCSEIPSTCLWHVALGAKVLLCRLIAAVVCGDSSPFQLFFP